jgi:formate hydrogenlyase subunit 3/multisubunit Na+/H+ antiporter MnhD subunit
MTFLTLYILIGLYFTLIEAQGQRPSFELIWLWPMALVSAFFGVVLDNLEAGEL